MLLRHFVDSISHILIVPSAEVVTTKRKRGPSEMERTAPTCPRSSTCDSAVWVPSKEADLNKVFVSLPAFISHHLMSPLLPPLTMTFLARSPVKHKTSPSCPVQIWSVVPSAKSHRRRVLSADALTARITEKSANTPFTCFSCPSSFLMHTGFRGVPFCTWLMLSKLQSCNQESALQRSSRWSQPAARQLVPTLPQPCPPTSFCMFSKNDDSFTLQKKTREARPPLKKMPLCQLTAAQRTSDMCALKVLNTVPLDKLQSFRVWSEDPVRNRSPSQSTETQLIVAVCEALSRSSRVPARESVHFSIADSG
mmetsp:Transcript_158659/g.292234  ORF Transcript_158659/g.292234 Transcript_158659/m.292234 type:complete len:309 (+) Transcript_158659:73-999(+)